MRWTSLGSWLRARSIPWTEIRHERNRGLCATLNDALAVARGRYVAIIAADDHWEPEKLEHQVQLLDQHPDAAVVYSDNYYMDADGARLDRIWRTEGLIRRSLRATARGHRLRSGHDA